MALIVLAAAAWLAAYLEPAPDPVTGLARVSDGDSFRLGEQKIRLLGMDAPELRQTCLDRNGESWQCGEAARNRMSQLLAQGTVHCEPRGTDRYGRILAHCTIAERDLGAMMVGEGLAIASGEYGREEAAARKAKLGVWQGGFDTPQNWRQDHTGIVSAWDWLSFF